MRLASPRRLKLGAERYDQEHRQAAEPLDGEIEQLARGRVNPMSIFENHYHRPPAAETLKLPDQRLQCPFLFVAEPGNDMKSAISATSSSGVAARASRASSFSSRDAGGSFGAEPDARTNWSMNGNNALSWR